MTTITTTTNPTTDQLPAIWWDADNDPANPGWVLRWAYSNGQVNDTALDATSEADALAEAADYLARQGQ